MSTFPIHQYPYTDLQDVNLDYILKNFKVFEDDITSLKQRMTSAEDNINSLSSRMSAAEGRITSLTSRMSTAEAAINALSSRMSTAENNITTIQGNITSLGNRMNSAESDISTNSQLIGENATAINTINGQITTINNTINDSAYGNQALLQSINANENELEQVINNNPTYMIEDMHGVGGDYSLSLKFAGGQTINSFSTTNPTNIWSGVCNLTEFLAGLIGTPQGTPEGVSSPRAKFIVHQHSLGDGRYIEATLSAYENGSYIELLATSSNSTMVPPQIFQDVYIINIAPGGAFTLSVVNY